MESKLADREHCTGCAACVNVCSYKAIEMMEKEAGFLYPQIDLSRCIGCGLCEETCPESNGLYIEEKIKGKETGRLKAAMNDDMSVRLQSSSGGIFSMLAEKIIELGGVVFGVELTENLSIRHNFIKAKEDICRFRTSKYVQSDVGKMYMYCREKLEEGLYVLFSGTSCQIEGLLSFLGKNYDRLITVDLICSGNTSPGLWRKYLDYMGEIYRSRPSGANFREKKYGWDRFSISLSFESSRQYRRIFPNDPWAWFFLHHHALRKCCFECKYKSYMHRADFTLGDFWGVQSDYPELYDDKGLSFVLLNTSKAENYWAEIGALAWDIPRSKLEEHNQAAVCPPNRPPDYEEYIRDYQSMNFKSLMEKYVHIPVWKRCNGLYDLYWKCRSKAGNAYRAVKKIVPGG